jgi:formylmethanofuran dehydrogenase subunit E
MSYEKVVSFHGHSCPGLAIGYRAAKAAMSQLGIERAEDEELVAIVETDACGVDAIQALLGCTLGKGNLIYRDYGKQAYTVANRATGKAVRIVLKPNSRPSSPEYDVLRQAVLSEIASEEQQQQYQCYQQERLQQILNLDEHELFKIEIVDQPLPDKARIFNSVLCEYCGENVMEPRARLRDGKISCLACDEAYSRGWGNDGA